MIKISIKKFFILYGFALFGLFLYSFTQTDLGLALTRFPKLFFIQRAFQTIGYFNRPLSSILFIAIVSLLFICYFCLLYLVYKNRIKRRIFWRLVVFSVLVLAFSYNAFSYDLFNYIFDAKIFTFYGKNPYIHKALDFPADPMLGFLHWTHRTYPYGPIWLGITIPLSYVGFNIFLLTFFLFKLLAAGSYLGSVYFLEKIMIKINPNRALFASAFFAFNPLVLIESLVSAHNDIFMMFLALLSFYLLVKKNYAFAFLFLLFSIGTKYATVFLLPVFLAVTIVQLMKENITWRLFIWIAVACLSVGIIAATGQSGKFQPWYLLFILPFCAMITDREYFFLGTSIITLGALFTYLPFLYLGNWDKPVPDILRWIYFSSIVLTIIVCGTIAFRTGSSKFKIKSAKRNF